MPKSFKYLIILASFGLIALGVIAQGIAKPTIGNITTLPSEPIRPGSCTSSTAGYLEKAGKIKLTDAEIGRAVSRALKEGYVVTIYPEAQRGVFVAYECPISSGESKAP